MKTIKQVFIPIAVVMALVFGVTFLSNYTTSGPRDEPIPGTTSGESVPVSNEIPLRFGATIAERSPDHYYVKHFKTEYEVDQPGAFDFWFQNRNSQPALLRLNNLSCQCQSVDAVLVPPDVARRFYRESATAAWLTTIAVGMPDIVSLVGLHQLSFSASDQQKFPLTAERDTLEVPAAPSEGGPQIGFVRLHWKGKSPPGPKRLTGSFQMQLPKANARLFSLEVHTIVLPPIRYWPMSADFGDLTVGANATREFFVVSSTRTAEELQLKIKDDKAHPCIVLGEPERLTEAELKKLEARLQEEWKEPILLLSAFRVRVTAHENYKGAQLDLGPINRNLTVSAANDNEYPFPIKGMVRGDVRLAGGPEDRDFIDLGQSISSERGRAREIRLVSDRNDMELELLAKENFPPYLEATLTALGVVEGKKQWLLKVRVPEKKLYGKLLPESGVTLQTKDSPPRRVRIPVRGQTFDTSGDF